MPDEYHGIERRTNNDIWVDIAVLKEARRATDIALGEIKTSLHEVKEDIHTANATMLEEFRKYSDSANRRFMRLELWRSGLVGAYTAASMAVMAWWKLHNGR